MRLSKSAPGNIREEPSGVSVIRARAYDRAVLVKDSVVKFCHYSIHTVYLWQKPCAGKTWGFINISGWQSAAPATQCRL